MSDLHIIAERDSRDRITDQLGFGVTAPIQNLPLPEKTLATPFDTRATIPLVYSQARVRYQVSTEDCGSLGDISEPSSEGGPLSLKTGKITEDRTFNICALKDNGSPVVALNGTIRVRVGLDSRLDARILIREPAKNVRILDPTLDRPYPDTAARLAPFGSEVLVQVDDAQEGIDYTLEDNAEPDKAISRQAVRGRGPGQSIELRSLPLKEDLVLRIRARRGTNAAENQLIEIKLPLKIMADPELSISLAEGSIAAYRAVHRLRIATSQTSAIYRVFARPIPDLDYRPSSLPAERVLKVAVAGEPQVRIALPPPLLDWRSPPGFVAVAEPVAGSGGDLLIPLPAAEADQLLLVQAIKSHAQEGGTPLPSSIRLATAAALLVRPNPDPELELALNLESGGLSVSGGEPGVYYHLRAQEAAKPEFPRPAYMHQRDPSKPALNKGIGDATSGGLTIGVDLSIARDATPYDPETARNDPAFMLPLSPLIETKRVARNLIVDGGVLYLRAARAQTQIAQQLTRNARVPVTAKVSVDATEIEAGKTVRFVVSASDPKDRYQLLRIGKAEPERRARNGNGDDIPFNSDPIEKTTWFLMRVTRLAPEGFAVARDVPIQIRVVDAS